MDDLRRKLGVLMWLHVVTLMVTPGLSFAVDSHYLDEQPITQPGEYLDEPSPASDGGEVNSTLRGDSKENGGQPSSKNGGLLADTDVYDQARPRLSRNSTNLIQPNLSVSPPKSVSKELAKKIEEFSEEAGPGMAEMATAKLTQKYLSFRNVALVTGLILLAILVFLRRGVEWIERRWLGFQETAAATASDLKALPKRFAAWIRSRSNSL